MALFIETKDGKALLDAIIEGIRERRIITWRYDLDRGFTHVMRDGEWEDLAWLWPEPVYSSGLQLFIREGRRAVSPEQGTEVYAVYHGRFLEMLLAHYHDRFEEVKSTAKAVI